MRSSPLPTRVATNLRCSICHNRLDLVIETDGLDHQVGPVLYAWGRHRGEPSRDHAPMVTASPAEIDVTRATVARYLASLPH